MKHQFDTGWSWAVDIGTFIAIFVLIAWLRVAGLLFVEIQALTDASTADVAWVTSANVMSWHFVAPFSAILAARFGTRKVVAFGGFIVFLSTSSGFFIRELPGFIAMGTCIGIGGALCYTPSIVFLSYYFRRRLGVATGITSSGSSLSTIIMSPACGYLLETYGLPGTLLIFGGISLHLLVSAALFFPVDQEQLRLADEEYTKNLKLTELKKTVDDFEEGREVEMKMLPTDENSEERNQHNSDDEKFVKPEKEKLNPMESIHSIHASMTSVHDLTRPNVVKRLMTNPNLWLLTLGYSVGGMMAMALVKYGPPYCIEYDVTIVDVAFFLALSGIPGIIIRLLIGLISDVSFVKNKIERYRLFVLGILLTGAGCFVFLLTKEYVGFLLNFLLMGVSGGIFYTLSSVSAFDLLGQEDYLQGFGIINAFSGLLFVLDSTVVARLRDATGNFAASFLVCGCLGLVTSLIMFVGVPFGQRFNQRKQNKS